MRKVFDFEQGSLEWHEAKWGLIGGTLSKGLLVKSDTLLIDILSQKLEEFEPTDSFESSSMANGKAMEPFAVQWLEQYTGYKFEHPALLYSDENELLCLSPDGLTADETVACETKCLQRKAHTEILFNDKTPDEYLPQIVHYFTVNPKLQKLYFLAFRPESPKHFLFEYTRDTLVDLKWTVKVELPQIGVKGQPIASKWRTDPDIKPIKDWVKESLSSAENLLLEVNQGLASIKNDF